MLITQMRKNNKQQTIIESSPLDYFLAILIMIVLLIMLYFEYVKTERFLQGCENLRMDG